jgi:hypothetical protein
MAGLAIWKKKRMVTAEPILDFDSGHNGFPEPSREKVEELLELLAPHTRIHLKNNLRRILPESRYYGNV